MLGYDPEPWKPVHSLVIVKLMAFELNISWWTDIAFTHLIQKLGVEKVAEIDIILQQIHDTENDYAKAIATADIFFNNNEQETVRIF